MIRLKSFLVLVLASALVIPVWAQESEVRENALRVFLDCNVSVCDDDYFRTEIDFVNWVRDRTLADVQLIVTGNSTGGGGQFFSFDFIGLSALDGNDDALSYTTNTTDSEVEILEGLTQIMAVGLARFSAIKGEAYAFQISSGASAIALEDRIFGADEVEDPWDFWVFELGMELDLRGKKRKKAMTTIFISRQTELQKSGNLNSNWIPTIRKMNISAPTALRQLPSVNVGGLIYCWPTPWLITGQWV